MKLMASDFSGVVVEETHHQEAGTGADREAGAEQCGSQEGGVHVDSWLYSAVLAPPGAEGAPADRKNRSVVPVLVPKDTSWQNKIFGLWSMANDTMPNLMVRMKLSQWFRCTCFPR